jgi:outer membrane protein assembly factor BamA
LASDVCISDIKIFGNKKTKEFTIMRELSFRAGDVLPEDKLILQLEISKNNLVNTSLFNYVYVDYIPDSIDNPGCVSCIVTITVEERWYYWPQVNLKLEDRNLSSWLHEKDFSRVTIGWGLRVYNVFGMRHKITMSDYFGYEKGLRLAYSNISLDRERTQMLGFGFTALFNKTINAGSENDRVVYLKDPNNFLDRTFEGLVSYSYRPGIHITHSFDVGFRGIILGDTALKTNKDYWGTDDKKNNMLQLSYKFNYEHRDYVEYPTKGYFIGSELKGVMADDMRFFYGELNMKLQYYKEVFPRWFWSSRLNSGITFKNKKAYIFDQHVGYDDKNITGYDYYVVDGQHHAILNNDLRFLLMPKRIFYLGASKNSTKFRKIHLSIYAKLTYDAGYVYHGYRSATNTLANTFLWGSGAGLDFVTYYDIVLNCSYAINKMGEGNFYFGIKAPVF